MRKPTCPAATATDLAGFWVLSLLRRARGPLGDSQVHCGRRATGLIKLVARRGGAAEEALQTAEEVEHEIVDEHAIAMAPPGSATGISAAPADHRRVHLIVDWFLVGSDVRPRVLAEQRRMIHTVSTRAGKVEALA